MAFVYPKHTAAPPTSLPETHIILPEDDPFDIFERWFSHALEHSLEANAVAVASAEGGQPTNRIVYLRYWDRNGFVFFTNLTSQKAHQLLQTPPFPDGHATELLLYWKESWRQIRIFGRAEVAEEPLSDAYFAQRSRESQLGAWASLQSQPLDSSEEFEKRYSHFEEKFRGQEIPRPKHWGGIRIVPMQFEFWQGMPARLHQRYTFCRQNENKPWNFRRLFP